jgi:hypothetical protein
MKVPLESCPWAKARQGTGDRPGQTWTERHYEPVRLARWELANGVHSVQCRPRMP